MRYRKLGHSDLVVSVIGMGTWQFGGEWGKDFEQAEVDEMFDRARETGITLIDTAECYGDHVSEAFIGSAIERDRDRWVLATKFGHKFHAPFDRSEPRTPADVRTQVEGSLRALRTDYIDLYQYHSWRAGEFFNDDVKAELEKIVDEGKVRYLGNSISGKTETHLDQVRASTDYGVVALQCVYNRLDQRPEPEIFPSCLEQGVGVLARVPLASGYLSGKYKPGHTFGDNEVRGKWHDPDDQRKKLEAVEKIVVDEVPGGVGVAQWALAWCLQHPAVTCVIPGCKNPEQVVSNASAADLELVRSDHPQAVTVC